MVAVKAEGEFDLVLLTQTLGATLEYMLCDLLDQHALGHGFWVDGFVFDVVTLEREHMLRAAGFAWCARGGEQWRVPAEVAISYDVDCVARVHSLMIALGDGRFSSLDQHQQQSYARHYVPDSWLLEFVLRPNANARRFRVPTALSEISATYGDDIALLRGRQVHCARIIFYEPWDNVHAATPVVLVLDNGVQLEIWTVYGNEVGVSFNQIDLSAGPFAWTDSADRDCRWITNGHPVLAAQLPNMIDEVDLLAVDDSDVCSGLQMSFTDEKRGATDQLIIGAYEADLYIGTRMPPHAFEVVSWDNDQRTV